MPGSWRCVALLGAYYAATDGVLSALAGSVLEERQLTTGLAVVSTITALARLLAASLFGAVWNWWGRPRRSRSSPPGSSCAGALAAGLLRVGRPWTPAAVE